MVVTDKRRLRVARECVNDPALASIVWAVNREREHIRLYVDPETVKRLHESRLFGALGDYCGLIHGCVPGGTDGLVAAQALFQGLQRPRQGLSRDDDTCIYVLNPDQAFWYGPGELRRDAGPRALPKPHDSVFVVYAELKPKTYVTVSGQEIAAGGEIRNWEWVLSEIEDPTLPAGFQRRYATRHW